MAGTNHEAGIHLEEYCCRIIKKGTGNRELQEKWINPDPNLQHFTETHFASACQNHRVFKQRSGKRPKNIVQICSVRGTPYESLHDTSNLSIYAGGPGSMVGAALDSAISSNNVSGKTQSKVMFVTYDFEHSNARSSAYYFHIRHSNALDADPSVRGHRILHQFLRRKLMSPEQLITEAKRLPYLKIDLSTLGILSSPSHCLRTIRILVGGLWHTCRNLALENIDPMLTDWVRNRAYSQNSVPVLRYLESAAEKLEVGCENGEKPMLLVGTENDTMTPEAIHVLFSESGVRHTELENELLLKTNQIRSRVLSELELTQLMGGHKGEIYKAYVYPGDGRITANMNLVLSDIVQKSGNSWREGVAVKRVYIDDKGIRGVEFHNIETGELWYQPCSSIVLSLGYTASYQFETPQKASSASLTNHMRWLLSSIKWNLGFKSPVPNVTTAAGCTGYFLTKGKIPIIGAQNSHWTEVAYSPEEDITLAKLTGGGNIGSEQIPAAYVLNNLEHLRKIFGHRLIDVLSIDSCPRAINPQNDIQFYQVAPGFVISLGLGGTGMTKSGANGALSYLLSHPNQTSIDDVIPGSPDLFASVNLDKFVTQCVSSTQRALNLRTDCSALELLTLTGVGLGLYFTAKRLFFSTTTSHHQSSSNGHTPIDTLMHKSSSSSSSSSRSSCVSPSPSPLPLSRINTNLSSASNLTPSWLHRHYHHHHHHQHSRRLFYTQPSTLSSTTSASPSYSCFYTSKHIGCNLRLLSTVYKILCRIRL